MRLPLPFWYLWVAETSSSLGTSLTQFALPAIVYEITGSPVTLALTFASGTLPFVLAIPMGTLVDRLDRQRLMTVGNIAAVTTGSGFALLAATMLPVWWGLWDRLSDRVARPFGAECFDSGAS